MISCTNPSTESFDWLVGEWQRTNEKEGRETFEMWNKVTDYEYSGFGVTLQDGDTLKALISGGGEEIPFDFKRVNPKRSQ